MIMIKFQIISLESVNTIPTGSLIKITHSSKPYDGLGFGSFGSITLELRGTIFHDNKNLSNVTIDQIIQDLEEIII